MKRRRNNLKLFGALGCLILSSATYAGTTNADNGQAISQDDCSSPAIRNGDHYEGLGCESKPAQIVVSLQKNKDGSYKALSTIWDICLKPGGNDTCQAGDKGYAIVSVFASPADISKYLKGDALAFISSNSKYSASTSRTQFYITPENTWPVIDKNGDPDINSFVGQPTTDNGSFTGLQTGFCNWPFPDQNDHNNITPQQFKVIFTVTGGKVSDGSMTANFALPEGNSCGSNNNFNE